MLRRLGVIAIAALTALAIAAPAAQAGKTKDVEWCFSFSDGWSGCGTATSNDTIIHGMTIHVSCSDLFADGYGSTAGPSKSQGDPKVVNFHIERWDINKKTQERFLKKECGQAFSPPPSGPPPSGPPPSGPPPPGNPPGNAPAPANNPNEIPTQVLGNTFDKDELPATGPEHSLLMLLAAVGLILVGRQMVRRGKGIQQAS